MATGRADEPDLVVVTHYRAHARIGPGLRRTRLGAVAMTVLTVVDGAVAVALFAARR